MCVLIWALLGPCCPCIDEGACIGGREAAARLSPLERDFDVASPLTGRLVRAGWIELQVSVFGPEPVCACRRGVRWCTSEAKLPGPFRRWAALWAASRWVQRVAEGLDCFPVGSVVA